MITIQLFESSAEKDIEVIKDDPERDVIINIDVKRSWQPIINILQTEDESGYGTQFRSTPPFNYNKGPSCFTWIVIAMLSTCKELWEIIDTKESPFRESSWEGWMMTYAQCLCFENNVVYFLIELHP